MDRRISDLDREIHLRPARPVIGLLLRVGQFQLPLVNPIDAQDDRPVWRVLIRGDQLRQATVAALVKIGGDSIALPGEKASKALGFRGYLNYPFCPSVTSEGQWSHHLKIAESRFGGRGRAATNDQRHDELALGIDQD